MARRGFGGAGRLLPWGRDADDATARQHEIDIERLTPPPFRRILVPMKLGVVGEEMVATAVKLAAAHGAAVDAIHVIRVPLDLDMAIPMEQAERRAEQSLAQAHALGAEAGVDVIPTVVRARTLGRAILDHAAATGADVILLGSAPRWRRQSRFFSPTVDFVLRQAPIEVVIVAFPQDVLDDELARV
jgi:nucleotide-binding universal stress UspA family protein